MVPDKCLNENWFGDLAAAREKIAPARNRTTTEERPHSSLRIVPIGARRVVCGSTDVKWGKRLNCRLGIVLGRENPDTPEHQPDHSLPGLELILAGPARSRCDALRREHRTSHFSQRWQDPNS
jgi:hypothetical protein